MVLTRHFATIVRLRPDCLARTLVFSFDAWNSAPLAALRERCGEERLP